MCQTGSQGIFFTDADSCFIGDDMSLYRCMCPIATCTSTPTGNACRFTSGFLVFCGLLLLIWIMAAGAYFYVVGIATDRQRQQFPEKYNALPGGYYREKLFGVPGSSNVGSTELIVRQDTR
ncbi:hypothetical protein TRVL_01543 [Trypanosoma vivax]|uniref:Uncharacterized protein n=1 Tax=Trypanosoma vivax (strain Y486) TaxID=1055687 RepID=G0TSY3_TRYVY|nr:hypothetical protein TRVL_01543 [Trypanosoma vivax]CCC47063.1 conserved hypothetical protein [Trypanosoma vivax Y486]